MKDWSKYALGKLKKGVGGIILESLSVRRPYLALIQKCDEGVAVKFLHKKELVASYEVHHSGKIVGHAHPDAFITFVCIEEAHHKAKKRLG